MDSKYRYDLESDHIIEYRTEITHGGRVDQDIELDSIPLDEADEYQVREATIALDGCDMTVDEWYEAIDENCDGDEDEALNDKRELLRRKARAERDTQTFIDTYKPIPVDPESSFYFERDFKDFAWQTSPDKYVWTLIDTNGDGMFFVPGRHYVNRYAAVLCAVPWTDATIELAYD
jgi:hypothetical protein